MKCLVTGGAGYIGSVTSLRLREAGHQVVVLDDLRGGGRAPADLSFVNADISDAARVCEVLRGHQIDVVVHLAAYIEVGASMSAPGEYFENNVGGLMTVLAAMQRAGVARIVYASSAAVYGNAPESPIDEASPLDPINVYGETKRMGEQLLRWYAECEGFSAVALRFFNVAGAYQDLGEAHQPETHLVPRVLDVAAGRVTTFKVFGDDYDTPDGTCLRDFVHVVDIADAHVRAVACAPSGFLALNLGNTQGYSVLDVVKTAERVTGQPIPFQIFPRRPGDPPVLVATNHRSRAEIGWRPTKRLDEMILDQWEWLQRATPLI